MPVIVVVQVVEFEDNTSVRCDNIIYATGTPQILTRHAHGS